MTTLNAAPEAPSGTGELPVTAITGRLPSCYRLFACDVTPKLGLVSLATVFVKMPGGARFFGTWGGETWVNVWMILPPEIRDLVTALRREIEVLRAENAALRQRVADLQRQLDKNSSNSSKPPSSDGLKKPPRVASGMRGKSGKTSGGQVGHAGGTLKQVAKPDVVERHEAQACRHCLAGLTAAMVKGVEKRQVFDLPEPRLDVTEHQAMIYRCACCRGLTTAAFPEGWPRRPSTARGAGRRRFISMCSSSFPRTGSRRRWPTCSAQRRFVQ